MSNNLINGDSFDFVPGTEETAFGALSSRVTALESADEPVELYSGSAGVGDTITLSESFRNFRWLMFVTVNGGVGVYAVQNSPGDVFWNYGQTIERGILTSHVNYFVADDVPYEERVLYILGVSTLTGFTVRFGKTHRFYANSEGTHFDAPSACSISTIYGIGRISN